MAAGHEGWGVGVSLLTKGGVWTFAFKIVHFGAFCKALLTEQRHPPSEDFAILRQQQQTPFREQEA